MSWAYEPNSVPGDTNDITWTVNELHRLVNMSPQDLERWEATPQSRAAPDHALVARIAQWLRTPTPQLTAGDLHDMRDAIDYIHEHVANPPQPDPLHPDTLAHWRDALKNHGHDPAKDPGH